MFTLFVLLQDTAHISHLLLLFCMQRTNAIRYHYRYRDKSDCVRCAASPFSECAGYVSGSVTYQKHQEAR